MGREKKSPAGAGLKCLRKNNYLHIWREDAEVGKPLLSINDCVA